MLTCKLGNEIINCYDGTHGNELLKKWSQKGILKCPVCGNKYEFCNGRIRNPYFRHLNQIECDVLYYEPETEDHERGKLELFSWISKQEGVSDVVLEGWLSETKQRPDVMFNYNGKICVIEYQCSLISTEYIERHELYQAAGINDIWICGTEKYFQYYHNGNGNKRINYLESQAKMYYDVISRCIYYIDRCRGYEYQHLQSLVPHHKGISRGNIHSMMNIYDYRVGMKNYYYIKDSKLDHIVHSYLKDNFVDEYQQPVLFYGYHENNSLARCYKIDSLRLTNIV